MKHFIRMEFLTKINDMKRKLFTLIVAALLSSVLFAQNDFVYKGAARPYYNEISLGYGIPTLSELATGLGVGITAIGGAKVDHINSSGAIAVEYQRYIKSGRFAYGGIIGYEHINCVYKEGGDMNMSSVMVLPSCKLMWFNKKHFGMYSRVAAGVWLTSDNATFGFQADPIGMEFGGAHFRGYLQAGFGNLGIFQAGVRYAF